MKKIIVCTLILLAGSAAFADEIHYLDGTVAKGKIIQVTPNAIEYSETGGRPLVVAERSRLFKIVYDDGSTVMIMKKDSEESSSVRSTQAPAESDGRKLEYSRSDSRFSIAIESGWNGYCGLFGGRIDYAFTDSLSINGGLGLGLWMYRLSAGMRWYANYPYGLALGIGVAYNTGSNEEMKQKGKVETSYGTTFQDNIYIKEKPVTTLNFTLAYNFRMGSNILYVETGYAVPLNSKKYTYRTDTGNKMTKEEKDAFDIMAPGGIMLSVGYAFF